VFVQALPVEQTETVESVKIKKGCKMKAEGKMYNPLNLWVAEIHIKEELQKAELARRVEAVCKPQSGWNQRIGLALSEVLITSGEKLRERYDPGSCYETL
jgi:hypothetical protein